MTAGGKAPKDSALPFSGVAVENFKPSGGIALRLNFGASS